MFIKTLCLSRLVTTDSKLDNGHFNQAQVAQYMLESLKSKLIENKIIPSVYSDGCSVIPHIIFKCVCLPYF